MQTEEFPMAGRWTDNHQDEWRARDDEPWFYGRRCARNLSFRRSRPEDFSAPAAAA